MSQWVNGDGPWTPGHGDMQDLAGMLLDEYLRNGKIDVKKLPPGTLGKLMSGVRGATTIQGAGAGDALQWLKSLSLLGGG